MENLIVEREDAVAVVTINRPKTLNALNSATLTELEEIFGQFSRPNTDVRAIIITGAGEKSFVAGADIAEIRELDIISGKDFAARGLKLYSMIEKLRIPVIAAVNGFALGGGCEMAMSCHLRLASDNAKFGQPEINLGIIPGYGGTQRLPRLVGRARALDMMLTGRMIAAAEALQWGLVNAVVPQAELLPTARKLAVDLASKPKQAVVAILEAVDAGLQLGLDRGLQVEENLFAYTCGTDDKTEGTTAFLEKRKADFKGPATPSYVAGVNHLILCSPPQKDKKIAPEILVAAREFNINNIFKVGGVQAIAAMAFGTETIPKVQKVIGPGNKWVNAAKQLLSNIVAIDNPAGPSEILIIADESTNINYLIVDFLSQLEHDPDNIGIIVSNSAILIQELKENFENYLNQSERKGIIKQALKNSLIIQTKNLDDSIRISNLIAPEHLEILIKKPESILEKINNAGAIFLGPYSPVPLGDYSAGTNHILPTGGNAKKFSGLNVYDFLKIIDILECNEEGLKKLSKSASIIAEFEGLYAHKKSIEERLKNKK